MGVIRILRISYTICQSRHSFSSHSLLSGCGFISCLSLCSCVKYVPEPEDGILLHTSLEIYRHFDQFPHALRLSLMLNDTRLTKQLFLSCSDRYIPTNDIRAKCY